MKKQRRWFVSVWAFLCVMLVEVKAESWVGDTIPLPMRNYSIGKAVDSISNASVLSPFFEWLDSLLAGKDTVLTVVHLGDSHIQAGYYSGKLMRLFQAQFGNAGRGWVSPLKLGRTNEPDDYFITSNIREWIFGRCVQKNRKCPIGIGGMGIQSTTSSIDMDLYIAPNNGAGYSFNQVLFYRGEKAMPMLPTGLLKDSVAVSWADSSQVAGVLVDTFRISGLVDTLRLHSSRKKPGTEELLPASSFRNLYYGFNLINGNSGVLYHSIGINGAMFVHYTDESYIRQLALLQPTLLIVSLGTNETFGRRFQKEEMVSQVRTFLSLVKKQLPQTAILLTTPPECYKRTYVNKKRTYVRNTQTQLAAQALLEAAQEENVACWDLFTTTGGKSSCVKWQKERLMGRDRVHFTKEGYREQGVLLYRALMQSFNQWKAEKAQLIEKGEGHE